VRRFWAARPRQLLCSRLLKPSGLRTCRHGGLEAVGPDICQERFVMDAGGGPGGI
jgi:hypothetical protein